MPDCRLPIRRNHSCINITSPLSYLCLLNQHQPRSFAQPNHPVTLKNRYLHILKYRTFYLYQQKTTPFVLRVSCSQSPDLLHHSFTSCFFFSLLASSLQHGHISIGLLIIFHPNSIRICSLFHTHSDPIFKRNHLHSLVTQKRTRMFNRIVFQ